ncbi:3-deoxy-D-manno-octulosonic acid transferase [Echinicola shivajiensis]|uniref:3-deoxy-D-manno-octulosonic acid transferase n=1 Tax=Echinicola shivajiensis TaxID=1035916 RepID=UPI001BFCBB23|nr:glycosyltransferase N-terminal domain-containing protein [Echinicola shivajiensis]
MKVLYDFSVWAMSGMLQLTKGGKSKLARLVKGREGVFDQLQTFRNGFSGKIVWFHVASLGEYEQAKPVIAALKKTYADSAVLVTFFSPSGYENVIKKSQPNVDIITYLPFDTNSNVQQFLNIVKPEIVFFVKYDLWANYILEAKNRQIPLFLFSASMRKEQVYFQSYGGFFRKVLKSFDHIFTQNKQTEDLLRKIEVEQVSIAGDTRFDNVQAISENPKKFPKLESFVNGAPVIVIGSAWQEDMDLIIPFINKYSQYKYIIAPHDIDQKVIDTWSKAINKSSIKYSEIKEAELDKKEVLFIDNVGMLSSLYQFAHIAYVGGAFGKGLHNILEPLAFRVPVLFGKLKKVSKFPEAAISQGAGCGFEIVDAASFEKIIVDLEAINAYKKAAKSADVLVRENLGSAQKIISGVKKSFNE